MIAISGDRDLLVRLFAGHISVEQDGLKIRALSSLPSGEVSVVYTGESREFPDLLVVDTPNIQEFFGWCSTYLPHWSPLSGGIRVVERQKLYKRPKSVWGDCPRPLLRGLLCLSLGELLFEWQLTNGRARPNILSLRSTFGYAASCAVIGKRGCVSDLLSRWVRAQHLLKLSPRRLSPKILKTVWAPIFKLVESKLDFSLNENVAAKLAHIVAGERQPTLFGHSNAIDRRRREHVVVELESFIHATSLVDSAQCFEAAFIASMMSTNPLGHFDVLSEMTRSEPRTLLWYSFLSGMFATDPAHPVYENFLYRLEGELRAHPSLKPDINLDELEVMMEPDGHISDGLGIGAKFINVELDYGVCASFRFQHEIPDIHPDATQVNDRQLFDELLDQLRGVFERGSNTNENSKNLSRQKKSPRKKSR